MNRRISLIYEPLLLIVGFVYYILVNSNITTEQRGEYWLFVSTGGLISLFGSLAFADIEWNVHDTRKISKVLLIRVLFILLVISLIFIISKSLINPNIWLIVSVYGLFIAASGQTISFLVKFGALSYAYNIQLIVSLVSLILLLSWTEIGVGFLIAISFFQNASVIIFGTWRLYVINKELIVNSKKKNISFNLRYFFSDLINASTYRYSATGLAFFVSSYNLGLIRNVFFFIDILHKIPRVLIMIEKANMTNGKKVTISRRDNYFYIMASFVLITILNSDICLLSSFHFDSWSLILNMTILYGVSFGFFLMKIYPLILKSEFRSYWIYFPFILQVLFILGIGVW